MVKREWGILDFLPCELETCLLSTTLIAYKSKWRVVAALKNLGKEIKLKKWGKGNNIKLDATIYTLA